MNANFDEHLRVASPPRRSARRPVRAAVTRSAGDLADPAEMIPVPEYGRVFELPMRAGLGECSPSGRLRLDALARWLQDVAYWDIDDAGLAQEGRWVLRKTRIRVDRFPRFGEQVRVRGFCSGLGRVWVERRTTITLAVGPGIATDGLPSGGVAGDVEAVAVWVHLDPDTCGLAPFGPSELAFFRANAIDRRVSARRTHPPPDEAARSSAWTFRAIDCDIAHHVNNCSYLQALEEEMLASAEPETIDVEIEFRAPSQPGRMWFLSNGRQRWITTSNGKVRASMLLHELHPQQP